MIKKLAVTFSLLVVALAHPAAAQRFMYTGVSDAEVLSFFAKLQSAVGAGNKAVVASMVNYPLRVNNRKGNKLVIPNSADLLKRYDLVFTPATRAAIAAEKPAKLVGSKEGAAIAAGLVWLAGKCDKKVKPVKCTLGVVSVNHEQ
jgi:hypothetical protein